MTAHCPTDRPLPEGWVDHPRVALSRRALVVAVGLTLIGVVGAVGSIWMRRTQLERTTEWLGADTIQAIQILPQVTLQLEPAVTAEPSETVGRQIDLTGMPGLGHLRHALLDQRHYDWDRRQAGSIDDLRDQPVKEPGYSRQYAEVVFSDPLGKFPSGSVRLELAEGWVESSDGQSRVPLVDRARPAVRHFLTVLSNAQQAHHDRRLHGTD